jgi:DNA-binding CsgD family transcriptional regulator/PAS domain-containing protein
MSNPPDHEGLVDLIYQAAVDTELWPEVLDHLIELVDGEAATLHWYDLFSGKSSGIGARVDQASLDKGFEMYGACSPLTEKDTIKKRQRLRNYVPKVRRDIDWLPKDEFIKTTYYNDFFQSFGFHSDVTLGLMVEDVGDGAFEGAGVNIFRRKRFGEWTDENMALFAALHPHLIRSYRLGRRISANQQVGESLMQFLDRAPWGVFILDRGRRVIYSNRLAQAFLAEESGLTLVGRRLSAHGSAEARRLHQLTARAATPDCEDRTGGSMTLATPNRQRPLALVAYPLNGEGAAHFPRTSAVAVSVTDLDASVTLPEKELRELFGLTHAESRVALALSEGLDPALVAKRLGTALPTVRTHLAHIFDKTETSGQAGLNGLLARVGSTMGSARP